MTKFAFFRLFSISLILCGVVALAPAPAFSDGYMTRLEPLGVGGCRTASSSQGTFKGYKNVSLEQCAKRCFGPDVCAGVEYNMQSRGCEVHWQPIASVKSAPNSHTICFGVQGRN